MRDTTNVMFIQSQMAFGADSLVHAQLMKHLDRSRFTVHVACTTGDGNGVPVSLASIERIEDIRLRRTVFAPGITHRKPRDVLRLAHASRRFPIDAFELARYIKNERIHVVHGTEKPRDAAYVMALSRLTGAKSVVHVHVKWSKEYSRVSRWAVRRADGVFGVSEYVTDTVVAMGRPRSNTYTILNCLDATDWNPDTDGSSVRREFGLPAGGPVLASVSRLFSWKGQRELIRAVARLVPDFPLIRLLIVGEDERYVHGGSFTDELRALVSELNVERNVIFTGHRRDVMRIMAACDVYAMPSFEEPFGVVFLEAMAMKKPVVAIDNGGTPEVVEHGKEGLLCPPWDIAALAENIRTLIANPSLCKVLGERGRARVLERFMPARVAGEAGAAYEQIVWGRPRPAGPDAPRKASPDDAAHSDVVSYQ